MENRKKLLDRIGKLLAAARDKWEAGEVEGALGLTGTPSYVIGNRIISGAAGYEELKKAVEDARKANAA